MEGVILQGGPDDGKKLGAIDWASGSTITIDVETTNKKGKTKVTTITYTNTGKKDKNGNVIFKYDAA